MMATVQASESSAVPISGHEQQNVRDGRVCRMLSAPEQQQQQQQHIITGSPRPQSDCMVAPAALQPILGKSSFCAPRFGSTNDDGNSRDSFENVSVQSDWASMSTDDTGNNKSAESGWSNGHDIGENDVRKRSTGLEAVRVTVTSSSRRISPTPVAACENGGVPGSGGGGDDSPRSASVSHKNKGDENTMQLLARRPLPQIPARNRSPRPVVVPGSGSSSPPSTLADQDIMQKDNTVQQVTPPPRQQSMAASSSAQYTRQTPSPNPGAPALRRIPAAGCRPLSTTSNSSSSNGDSAHQPLCRTKAAMQRTPSPSRRVPASQSASTTPTSSAPGLTTTPGLPARPPAPRGPKPEVKYRSESVPENLSPHAYLAQNQSGHLVAVPTEGGSATGMNSCLSLTRSVSQPSVSHTSIQPATTDNESHRSEGGTSSGNSSVFDEHDPTADMDGECTLRVHQSPLNDQGSCQTQIAFDEVGIHGSDGSLSLRLLPAFHDDRGSTFWRERCRHLEEEVQQYRAILEAKGQACEQLQEQLTMVRKNVLRVSSSCSGGSQSSTDPSVHMGVDVCDLSVLQVCKLLTAYGFEQYATSFRERNVDGEAFAALTAPDLESLGVKNRMHRNKILRLCSGS